MLEAVAVGSLGQLVDDGGAVAEVEAVQRRGCRGDGGKAIREIVLPDCSQDAARAVQDAPDIIRRGGGLGYRS